MHGNTLFATLHIVGSNNNLQRDAAAVLEYQERNAANLAWMKQAFDLATREQRDGVVLGKQADPSFEERNPDKRTGFNDFLAALEEATAAFAKPVLLIHGDSHYFQVDKPMIARTSGRRVEHFTRLEVFGAPDVHGVRVAADPADPDLFSFRPLIVRENLVPHRAPR